ncbi:hypothetical protein B0H11DRAFT_857748 [Mycena galericulata]|nr:hypothetical protein B0H11DRAFT_857748 [Mycena galericulata]
MDIDTGTRCMCMCRVSPSLGSPAGCSTHSTLGTDAYTAALSLWVIWFSRVQPLIMTVNFCLGSSTRPPRPSACTAVTRGQAAGKDIGMRLGSSAAAAAVRMLVDGFPACGLGVSVATDGTLHQTRGFRGLAFARRARGASSTLVFGARGPLASLRALLIAWPREGGETCQARGARARGDCPVLLLGIRLGLDGVNAVYYA